MKVLLQDRVSKRYYAGPQRWVEARAEALDFGHIEAAAKAYTEENAQFAEILVDDGTLPEGSAGCNPQVVTRERVRPGR